MAVTQHMTAAETGGWKQPSHTWGAFEKAEGTLTMVNNGMGNAPLQSTEAVLVGGPSLQVEEQLLYVETCPER